MFSAEDIQARLRVKPFRPLRIIATEGQRYDIQSPDLVRVGRHDITIGFPDPDSPTIYNGQTRIALVHVVALEDLPVPVTPGNGQN